MPVPAWPSSLPQVPLRDGTAEGLGDGRLRTPTTTGPAKVRRQYSAVAHPLTYALAVTRTQLATFVSFWETDLAGGSLPFTLSHPRTASTVTVAILDAPAWTQAGEVGGVVMYELRLSLEVLP